MTQPDRVAAAPDRAAPPEAPVKARSGAIVGLVLAVLSLQGQGSWTAAIQAVLGYQLGPDQFRVAMAISGLVTLGFALAGFVLGRRALAVRGGAASWEQHVGGAAVVLGAIGALISAVTVVGSLLAPSGQAFGPLM
ncbi:MAG TPA: hypothetical protein VFR87_07535 [Nocardioidaceae bacterium]|nr:hypothetical protein [Nocardioidaceae bacterium]